MDPSSVYQVADEPLFQANSTYFPMFSETLRGLCRSSNPCSTHDLDCRNCKLSGIQTDVRAVTAELQAEVTDDGGCTPKPLSMWVAVWLTPAYLQPSDSWICHPTHRHDPFAVVYHTHFIHVSHYVLALEHQMSAAGFTLKPTVDHTYSIWMHMGRLTQFSFSKTDSASLP